MRKTKIEILEKLLDKKFGKLVLKRLKAPEGNECD